MPFIKRPAGANKKAARMVRAPVCLRCLRHFPIRLYMLAGKLPVKLSNQAFLLNGAGKRSCAACFAINANGIFF